MREVSYDRYGVNCISNVFWDIDSADWGPTLSPKQVKDTVMSHVFGGTAYKVVKSVSRSFLKVRGRS